jgi:hypothetical protein
MSNTDADRDTTEQLREKIKSKMDVAKFFSGFITLFLGVAFKDISNLATDPSRLISFSTQLGMLFILAALGFSIATMFAYDKLMMPVAFWVSPHSNDDLRHQMVDAWRSLFVPAVATFFAGLLGLLVAVTKQPVSALLLWLIPIIVSFLCYRRFSKKQMFQD